MHCRSTLKTLSLLTGICVRWTGWPIRRYPKPLISCCASSDVLSRSGWDNHFGIRTATWTGTTRSSSQDLDQQLFINEVGSEKYCTEVNYPAIENLYFAGDTCINPIPIATENRRVFRASGRERNREKASAPSGPHDGAAILSRAPAVAVEDHASALCCRRQDVGRPRECGRSGLEQSTRRRSRDASAIGEQGRDRSVRRMVDSRGLALPAHLVRRG